MKSPLFYKALIIGLAILLALVGVVSAAFIFQTQRELEHFRREDQDLRDQLADVTLKLQQRQNFLDRLQTDPDFLERVARMKLGLAKPDELIYRFDVDPLTGAAAAGNDTIQFPQSNPPAESLPSLTNAPRNQTGTTPASPGTPHHN